jgi:hypothetical protein
MLRGAGIGACSLALLGLVGCGSSQPAEHDIWHTPALRPSRVAPASEAERELLTRIDDLPSDEPVSVGGQVFVAGEPYAAASGRTCRTITHGSEPSASGHGTVRLACEDGPSWVFVPDVFQASSQ